MGIDLLNRLRPADVHPARLAGPHAWARWGLGPPPPVDASLRFAVRPRTTDETIDRILRTMQARLARATWPPRPLLRTNRIGNSLEVTCGPAHATITIALAPTSTLSAVRPAGAVSDPTGWFILDETTALADRLLSSRSGADADLLEDLARWAALKGDAISRRQLTEPPIPTLLAELRHHAPGAKTRLDDVLMALDGAPASNRSPALQHGLRYLRDEAESVRQTRTLRCAATSR